MIGTRTLHVLWSACFVAATASHAASQTASEDPSRVDLHVYVPIHRPLLVDVTRAIDLPVVAVVAGKESRILLRRTEEWRFVDVHSVLKDDEEKCARQFLRAFSTDDGRVDDPEINGVRIDCVKTDGWSLTTADERVILMTRLERMLAQCDSVGLWIQLPSDASIGGEIEVELRDLLRIAFDAGADLESAPAVLELESVDDGTRVAVLSGRVACSRTTNVSSGALKLDLRLDARLEIDLAERRLRRLRLDGTAVASSLGLMHASGEGPVTVELVASTGDVATEAMKEKPVFREIECRVEKAGVSFRAPSQWFEGDEEDGQTIFYRSFSDEIGNARIAIIRYRLKFEPKTLADELRKQYPKVEIKAGKNPLGKGLAFSLENEGLKITGEYCVLDETSLVLIRLIAPPTLFDDSLKEYEAAKKTLKRLPKS